jgi:hypothetical protein
MVVLCSTRPYVLHCSKQSKRKDKRRGIPARLVADMLKLAGRWRLFDGLGHIPVFNLAHAFCASHRLLIFIAYMGRSVAICLVDSHRLFE